MKRMPGLPEEPRPRRGWEPILAGELASRARHAIAAVLKDVAKEDHASAVHSGILGEALLFGHMVMNSMASQDDCLQLATNHVERAIDDFHRIQHLPHLYGGYVGVAWTIQHLRALVMEPNIDPNQDIDNVLLTLLSDDRPWAGFYDLIAGLVGIGVYALERLPAPSGTQIIARVIAHLDRLSIETSGQISWKTEPSMLPARQRAEAPDGYFNLGVAHGVPGIIGLLSRTYRRGHCRTEARRIAQGAIRWVLSQRLPPGKQSAFPYWTGPGTKSTATRPTWCYGDLGVTMCLLAAARDLGNPAWAAAAIQIASDVARRSRDSTLVQDASLCHGAAGMAHMFNRLFQATGAAEFRELALYWYESTLQQCHPGQGVGGFESYWNDGQAEGYRPDPTFLNGSTGIALALLAGLSSLEPSWDRALLVDIPLHDLDVNA